MNQKQFLQFYSWDWSEHTFLVGHCRIVNPAEWGSPENDNITLKEFVQNVNIWHTIALKDIEQSNSMMEAFYHTIKYRYLYLMSIHNTEELITEFKNLLHEYHFHKPHYALGIFTPDEVRNGADVSTSYRDIYTQAARERRETNRNVHCTQKCS